MKIKINEHQAKLLKIIKENEDFLTQFENFCKVNSKEMEKIYLNLSNMTVAEIINNEVSLDDIESHVRNVESKLMDANRRAYKAIESLPENDLDLRIDNAFDEVNGKVAVIQLLIYGLKDLIKLSEENSFNKEFESIQTINVSAN